MFIHTLPSFVQSRILSFLALEKKRFCARELCRLARDVLSCGDGEGDFWVKRNARNLFHTVSDANNEWLAGLSLDSEEQKFDEEFESLPNWLENSVSSNEDLFLPWLPASMEELNSRNFFGVCENENDEDSLSEADDSIENDLDEVMEEIEFDCPANVHLPNEIERKAVDLRERILNLLLELSPYPMKYNNFV